MQQLLDKWERLRTSEYLRPDEKLMLNHCISDLKRFTDHSGEVSEMVGNRTAVNKQQTAVEWYAGKVHDLEVAKDFGAISVTEYYEKLTKAVQQAKEMEKVRLEKAYDAGNCDGHDACYGHGATYQSFDDYYEQTYGGNK
jgi:hypothetical protein